VDLQVDTDVSEKHIALKMEAVCPSPHVVATQKTNIDIFTAVRASSL
jgi:hypothetical protein